MEQNLLIGRKPTKKKLLKNLLFMVFSLLISSYMLSGVFVYWLNMSKNVGVIISFIFLSPIYFLFALNVIATSAWQYMEIKNNKLYFNQRELKGNIFQEVKSLFTRGECSPDGQIDITEAISLKIIDRLSFYRGIRNVDLVFQIVLKDGSVVTIIPRDLNSQKGQYARFVDMLENQGVYIIDPHGLRDILENDIVVIKDFIIKNHKGEWMYEEI